MPKEKFEPKTDAYNYERKTSGIYKRPKTLAPDSYPPPDSRVPIETIYSIEQDLGSMKHNANNPLATATYNADYLREAAQKLQLSQEVIDAIEDIQSALKIASQVLKTPLPALEEALGRIPMKVRIHELNQVLEEATAPFETVCQMNIRGNIDARAICDPSHLRQVLYNLIENGIKYNRSPVKKIEILVLDLSNITVITIRDNGMGIPADKKEAVFQKGYRVQNNETASISGTGTGLSYCKKAIEQMGGTITVDADSLAPGSVFLIELRNCKA